MSERYAGSQGEALRREDDKRNDSANRVDAEAARRDLLGRVPYGRALDLEDLVSMLDEGNQTNRAIVLRRALLDESRRNLPAGLMLGSHDVEKLRADSLEHPKRMGACPGIQEWPASR